MRNAEVYQKGELAGILEELEDGGWRFIYRESYSGSPVSLTMPVSKTIYEYKCFPPVLEGLLPEGVQLEALLRRYKFDRQDMFAQLMIAGSDLVGSLSLKEIK